MQNPVVLQALHQLLLNEGEGVDVSLNRFLSVHVSRLVTFRGEHSGSCLNQGLLPWLRPEIALEASRGARQQFSGPPD